MKKIREEESGITLIALVITIIVLLILAGISIATLTGENGILTQASKAKEQNEIGHEKEQITLAYNAAKIKKTSNSDSSGVTAEELNEQFRLQGDKATAGGSSPIVVEFEESGRKYNVDEEGNITEGKASLALTYTLDPSKGTDWTVKINVTVKASNAPQLEISEEDYIKQQIAGKTEEEKVQILLDGLNFWKEYEGETKYTKIEEYLQEKGVSTIEELYSRRYSSFDEYLIKQRQYIGGTNYINAILVKPQSYYIIITKPNGEAEATKNNGTISYEVDTNGSYTFVAQYQELKATEVVNVTNVDNTMDWKYKINEDNTVTILKYKGKDTEVIVPSQIEGLPVVEIGSLEENFTDEIKLWDESICDISQRGYYGYAQTTITKIVIPEGVTKIGNWLFESTLNLKEVILPTTLKEIGCGTFAGCISVGNIYLGKNIEKMDDGGFWDWESTQTINIEAESLPDLWSWNGFNNWNAQIKWGVKK